MQRAACTALPLLAVLTCAPRATAAPGDELLALVPDDAFAVLACPDFAALRERAERNDWVRLMQDRRGESLLFACGTEFETLTHTDFEETLGLLGELRGACLGFETPSVSGFVAAAPAERAALAAAMRAWLPDTPAATLGDGLDLGAARVDVVGWPAAAQDGWIGRRGHFAAFVEHPDWLALYSGDDAAALRGALEAGLHAASDHRAPVTLGLAAARAAHGATDGLELYVDLAPVLGEVERELARELDGALDDPRGLLGVRTGVTLYTRSQAYPGRRVECEGWLTIPRDTLAARLADTWAPIAPGLGAELPGGLDALYAWNWDLAEFYRRGRAAIEARDGADSLKGVDEALGAAQAMTGADPIRDVLNQLEGTVALYQARVGDAPRSLFDFAGLGLFARLRDGAAFLAAFERLVDSGPLESFLDLDSIDDVDVYVSTDGGGGGVAFLPKALVVATRDVLERAVRAATGAAGASLLDGSDVHAAFDESAGACALWIQRFTSLAAEVPGLTEAVAAGAQESSEPEAPPAPRFDLVDALLVFDARRTPEGFAFRLRSR